MCPIGVRFANFYQKNRLVFTERLDKKNIVVQKSNNTIEAFISLRSPYSYIGLLQAEKLSKHYQVPLKIKLLLPLVMRGVTITENKARYVVFDASREAKKLNIPFTGIADPLGQGIINVFQIFSFAEQQGEALAFIKSAYNAIYVDGLDLSQVPVIKSLCEKHHICYDAALKYNNEHDWQQWSDCNQSTIKSLGLWGAPCFRFKNVACWGQDRLAQIEQTIIAS